MTVRKNPAGTPEGEVPMETRASDTVKSTSVTRGDAPAAERVHDFADLPNAKAAAHDINQLKKELDATRAHLHRREAEVIDLRALVTAERTRYRELFEVAPEGSLVTDLNGAIREMNQSAMTLLNASSAYLNGKPIANYVAEEDRREFRVHMYRARTGTEAQEFMMSLTRNGLEPKRVSVFLFPITDERSAVVGYGFRLRDISAARAALVSSREPGALIRAALDALSAQVVVLDRHGEIVTVNRAWTDSQNAAGLFGPGAESGGNYLALCRDAIARGLVGAAAVRDAVVSVLDGRRRRADAVFAAQPVDGREEVWYSLRATRCDGPDPVHVVVTHEDVTSEHRELARERTLLQERAARTAAEAASQAKSEFLATLSHELRTPLNAIAGYAQLIEMGVRGPVTIEQAEDLRRILRSERHLLGLINELLNFSRLERGDVSVEITHVRVVEAVSQVLELVEPQANARSLQLSVQCASSDLIALADPEKIRQILINVLSNALKFTHQGGAIRIECDSNDLHVFVRIQDTGIGIPTPRLTEIFDPFVQVHRGYSGTADGVGLGLAISRNLARAMHGDLTATSELGAGSTFELRLPRAASRADLS